MRWLLSWRADPLARAIADGHYSRQTVGAAQFVPPGRCLVLVIPGAAYWGARQSNGSRSRSVW